MESTDIRRDAAAGQVDAAQERKMILIGVANLACV